MDEQLEPPRTRPKHRRQMSEEPTEVELAVSMNKHSAERLLKQVHTDKLDTAEEAARASKLSALEDCIFVGHTNTDMDSVSSAIACQELFGPNATAARASDVNSETKTCLEYWGLELPTLFKDLPDHPSRPVCLVDHQQTTQMAEGVSVSQIAGIIDHHALQSKTVTTPNPIFVDIRPWGSACTIIAFTFFQMRKSPSKNVAGMLLSGILSDTLNLKGPTTTKTDEMMVACLANVADVVDINQLAEMQFRAKSEMLSQMTATEIVMGDHKVFKYTVGDESFNVGFGVVECVGEAPAAMVRRKAELLEEMVYLKSSLDLEYSFFAVVDIVKLKSNLLICGDAEAEVAKESFGGVVVDGLMDLGGRVSRKKDFIAGGIDPVLSAGYTPSPPAMKLSRQQSSTEAPELAYDLTLGCCGKVTRAHKLRDAAQVLRAVVKFKHAISDSKNNCGHDHGHHAAPPAAPAPPAHGHYGHLAPSEIAAPSPQRAPPPAALKCPLAVLQNPLVVAVVAAAVGFVLGRVRSVAA